MSTGANQPNNSIKFNSPPGVSSTPNLGSQSRNSTNLSNGGVSTFSQATSAPSIPTHSSSTLTQTPTPATPETAIPIPTGPLLSTNSILSRISSLPSSLSVQSPENLQLIQRLRQEVNELNVHFKGRHVYSVDATPLCEAIEDILQHKFKKSGFLFVQTSPWSWLLDRLPQCLPDKQAVSTLLSTLRTLKHVFSDIGYLRSFVRISLNQLVLSDYLRALVYDQEIANYFSPQAVLLDEISQNQIFSILDTLTRFSFQLNFDEPELNNTFSGSALKAVFSEPQQSTASPTVTTATPLTTTTTNSPTTKDTNLTSAVPRSFSSKTSSLPSSAISLPQEPAAVTTVQIIPAASKKHRKKKLRQIAIVTV